MQKSPHHWPRIPIAAVVMLLGSATLLFVGFGSPSSLRDQASAAAGGPGAGQANTAMTPASLSIGFGPSPGPNQRGKISIQAYPANAITVSQVYFYIDNTFEGTDLAAPYCLGGSSGGVCNTFDTTLLVDGSHVVKAYMSFQLGSLESDATLTVSNTPSLVAPTTPTTPTTPTPTRPPATTGPPAHVAAPFVGLNVYELASDPGVNLGCGASFSGKLNTFFSSLPVGTVVRYWATQQMATSPVDTQGLQWAALDSVFSAAAAHGVHLIPVLGNEWTDCDGSRATQKQLSWFQSGYRSNADEGSIPYLSWVRAVVSRYAQSPAAYLWEPVNEPQALNGDGSCSESAAAQTLRSFYDTVGGVIHAVDPAHGVESGFLGTGNCGTANGDFAYVGASSGITMLTYHDYYPADQVTGGDPWNGIAVRVAQASALGKPILAGEDGIAAGGGCSESLAQRAHDFSTRAQAQFAAGVSGMLLWDWEQAPSGCSYDIGPGDPSLLLVRGLA